MTWREALIRGEEILSRAGITDGKTDAWLLLSHAGNLSRAAYLMEQREPVPEAVKTVYEELVEKRAQRIPLQHLTEEQEFFGYLFHVSDAVLVPRQDTEVLVEEALSRVLPGDRVWDLCTGSGCIAISLKKEREDLSVTASDLSEKALEVARGNAKRLSAEVTFLQGSLFEPVKGQTFHMIVSNPPYIPTAVIETLQTEVKDHDPFMALDGKEDGLFFYREIAKNAPSVLEKEGWILLEIGYDQAEAVSGFLAEAGFEKIRTVKDLAGLDRVVLGQLRNV